MSSKKKPADEGREDSGKPLRPLWKGLLRLSGLQIPVRLYAAAEDHVIHFHLLHKKDGRPVKQFMVESETGREVESGNKRKAAEVEPGLFVLLTEDELDKLEPESSRDIVVQKFVPHTQVKHMWYNRPYYLVPDGNEEAYWALVQVLEEEDVEGIAHWVMRKKEYAGALSVHNGCLDLVTLHFNEEVVQPQEISARFRDVPDKDEVKMAEQLIGMLETDFDPAEYRDTYRDRVLKFVQTKARGGKMKWPKSINKKQPESLADALKTSIANAKKN